MRSEDGGSMLAALIEGNRRFAAGTAEHPRQGPARRAEVSARQRPKAAIVACSDSRVAPEIVFDQGLGDLFVVRTAGNLLDELSLASLEYAAVHLGVELIVVMGHSHCGAVGAAAEAAGAEAAGAPGRLSAIVSALEPSMKKAREVPGDLVEAAARENVKSSVEMLDSRESVLASLVDQGRLRIVGMFYDLDRGTVEPLTR